jgi:hypothetical protein
MPTFDENPESSDAGWEDEEVGEEMTKPRRIQIIAFEVSLTK